VKRAFLLAALWLAVLDHGAAWAGWSRVRIGLCSLEAPAGAEPALRSLASRAWDILPQVESDLGVHPAARYRIILIPPAASRDSELIRLEAAAPEWAAGYLIPEQRIGAIRVAEAARYPYGTLEAVLAHEAAHMLIHDAAGERVPLWFNEGVATWQGRRWSLEDMMVYTTSLLTSDLPKLAALDSSFHGSAGEAQLAYAASFAFVSWNVHRHGRDLVRTVLRDSRSGSFAKTWLAATGTTLDRSEAAWRRESLIRYRWIPILTASSTLWIGITLLAMVAGVRKRARARRLREQWDREDQAAPEGIEEWVPGPEAAGDDDLGSTRGPG
jgi:hypothetical protein